MGLWSLLFGSMSAVATTRYSVSNATADKIKETWEKLATLIKIGKPSQLRQAVIGADKCLDAALKELFAGDSMGQRLKNAKPRFEKDLYNKLWEAHKLRNNVVHEVDFDPSYTVMVKALETFKAALLVLGVKV